MTSEAVHRCFPSLFRKLIDFAKFIRRRKHQRITIMSKRQKLDQISRFQNEFYRDEISAKLAALRYKNDENKPYSILLRKLEETQSRRDSIEPGKCVAHWFIRDFRVRDNNGLTKANKFAQQHNIPMLSFWVHCPEMEKSHSVGDFQRYYRFLSLRHLQEKLEKLNVNLVVVKADTRSEILPNMLATLKKYGVSNIYLNLEYEVDELRLATSAIDFLKEGISVTPCHNSCIVNPGVLKTKSKGTQFAVFSPWFKAWINQVDQDFLTQDNFEFDAPVKVEKAIAVAQNDIKIPEVVGVDKERFHKYWKCIGEEGALKQLTDYFNSKEIERYDKERDFLDIESVSSMSVHISSGTISTRTILQQLRESKKFKSLNHISGSGIFEWVRQVSWRDFYRHVVCFWPYVCMFKPFHLEYDYLEWEYNNDHFNRWCEGKTGYPIVDACMRCLNETGYLNNRGRLIVASFLSKHLLIDWRNGEQYFHSKLIDADFSSNNGGWGFSASTGVDPLPYFRIFNPWAQSQRFDPDGEFIKRWIPELRKVENYSLHKENDKVLSDKYPRPIVPHKESRLRALERYKLAMEVGKRHLL